MGNRRLGRKRLESVLKQMNATKADSTGSRSGLTGFHMPAFEIQPSKYYGIFDDFTTVSGVTDLVQDDSFILAHAASGLCGAMWDVTAGGGGTPIVGLDNAEVGGAVKLSAGTADDDVARMVAINNPFVLDTTSPRKVWFETRLKLSDVDASGFFVGLASSTDSAADTSILAGTPSLVDGIGWQIVDGTAAVTFATISAVGDAETVTQSSTSAVNATYVVLSIYFDGTTAHFYLNGTLVLSSSTNLPADDSLIFPHIEFIQQAGDDDTLHVDYIRACMER